MKLKTFSILSAVFAAAVLVLGCPTDSGDNGGNDDPAAAERLAADINKISADSATVNGATVTLSGRLSLQSQFTVPAGVTLDLTGDDAALELQDGAVLIVNGTVKAGPEKVRLDDNAGEGTISGSGIIQLKGKWYLLIVRGNENGPKTLTLDGVTLAGVADNNAPLVGVHDGGALVMKSGKITGNSNIHDSNDDNWAGGGGVEVGGTFTMEGGEISGNTAKGSRGSAGGGVNMGGNGVFTMKGGTIFGNTVESGVWPPHSGGSSDGGGVRMEGGTFTMEGGAIYGNTAKSGSHSSGGGVSIRKGSVFTLKGGTIYGKSDSLPAGTDPSIANSAQDNSALNVLGGDTVTAKWGTGGAYTKGGMDQVGDSNIVSLGDNDSGGTDDTLIAVPAK
jgi:hypothetical protein